MKLQTILCGIAKIVDTIMAIEPEDKSNLEVVKETIAVAITGSADYVDQVLAKFFVGPDSIFTGKVALLDANIFKEVSGLSIDFNGDGTNDMSIDQTALNLNGTIKKGVATTYIVLRNICATIMLIALLFAGIRILVTSNIPTKKSRWLEIMQDWLIGMGLLVFSHVIMVVVFYMSDMLVEALSKELFGTGRIVLSTYDAKPYKCFWLRVNCYFGNVWLYGMAYRIFCNSIF